MEIFPRKLLEKFLEFSIFTLSLFKGIVRISNFPQGRHVIATPFTSILLAQKCLLIGMSVWNVIALAKFRTFLWFSTHIHPIQSHARHTCGQLGGERRRWTQRRRQKVLSLTKSMTAKSRKRKPRESFKPAKKNNKDKCPGYNWNHVDKRAQKRAEKSISRVAWKIPFFSFLAAIDFPKHQTSIYNLMSDSKRPQLQQAKQNKSWWTLTKDFFWRRGLDF